MQRIRRARAIGLSISAIVLFAAGSVHAGQEKLVAFSKEFRAAMHDAGEACLKAQHENELTTAIEALQRFKIETLAGERSAEVEEIDDAIRFVLQWQDFLICRERELPERVRSLQLRLANLPIGHLMIPRSKILVVQTAEEIGKIRHDALPHSISNASQLELSNGGLFLSWPAADRTEDVHYIVAENKTAGTSSVVAELPPGTTECYIPPPDIVPVVSAEVDALATEAGQACLQAKTAQELDGVIEKLASFPRHKRPLDERPKRGRQHDLPGSSADLIALANFTQLDCALQFVCNWQDAIAELDAGHGAEAKNILERLTEPKMIFPIIERDEIVIFKDQL